MNILGIGTFEILLILIVAFVFLGPKDMAQTGRTIGRFLRKVVMSSEWRSIRQIAHEIQNTPNRLIREAGIEEIKQMGREINSIGSSAPKSKPATKIQDFQELDGFAAWTQQTPSKSIPPPAPADASESPDRDSASSNS